ncbi:MAG TPA: hypothetical protein VN792_03640 [Candidatus Acidoferrales bacterium]|nr:hypothetical protein [Candidatus Acidoferrales bacterium]
MKPTPEDSNAAHTPPQDQSAPVNTGVAYEAKDINVGGAERAGLILVIIVIVSLAVVKLTLDYFSSEQPTGTPEIAAGMRPATPELPPAPRMQGIPGDNVPPPEQQRRFQAAAAAELNRYGWVDAQHTIARIPIEEAMKILAAQGLPQSSATQNPASAASTEKKER